MPSFPPPPARASLVRYWIAAVAFACACACGSVFAAAEAPGVGCRFESWNVGKKTFRQIQVKAVTARTVSFVHEGGMASLPLRDLSPELQQLFGYNPAAESAVETKLAHAAKSRSEERKHRRVEQRELELASRFERLLQAMSEPPPLKPEVDLRPRFRELSLGVKDQGFRPSCSVFAVVSALEFQNSEFAGQAEKLSEEYLIWATRRTVRRVTVAANPAAAEAPEAQTESLDEGFSLAEVVAALRAYGIPLQSSMPNQFGVKMEAIPDPSEDLIKEARARRRVFIHVLSNRHADTRVAQIIHALNVDVPIAIGLRWPHYRTMKSGYLSEQQPLPNYAHAVTLVGYKCETGRVEDTVFLFKNSYGVSWGQGGYGWVTFRYLQRHLLDAILLEVQRNE